MTPHPNPSQGLHLHRIPLSYHNKNPEQSARELVFAFDPSWKTDEGEIEIIKFTDGITNNVSSRKSSDQTHSNCRSFSN
jgi:hypothetical protein